MSGTPDTADTTVLTYTVTDTNGANTSVDFTVSVSDGLALSARGDQNYTFDTEITALELPEATGGTGTLTYTLTSVPGLDFNANTRTLSGTPSTADTFDLTYTVTDANDASTTATFTIIVSDGLALDTPANQNYTEDKAITALELPEADGGTGTLTYTLTGPGDSPLPGGLTFSGRTLSGTPDTAATTILTYTVTDTNGANTSVDFTVSVSDGLALTASRRPELHAGYGDHQSGTAGSDRRHRDADLHSDQACRVWTLTPAHAYCPARRARLIPST